MRSASSRWPSARRARADSMATRRRSGGSASWPPARRPGRCRRPPRRPGRSTAVADARSSSSAGSRSVDRAEAGEQAEHLARLDGVGDRLAELHHHARRPLVVAGVEQRGRSPRGPGRARAARRRARPAVVGIDRRGAERRRGGEVERAGDLAAQRHAGGDRPVDEPGAGELVEQVAVDARRPGEQGDDGVLARRRAAAAPPRWRRGPCARRRRSGRRDGSRAAWSSDVAMTRTLPSAASTIRRASVDEPAGELVDDLLGGRSPARSVSMISPSTRWVASWRASARMRPATISRRRAAASSMRSTSTATSSATSRWASSMTTVRVGPARRRRADRARRAAAARRARPRRRASHDLPYPGGASSRTTGGAVGAGEPAEQRGAGKAHAALASLVTGMLSPVSAAGLTARPVSAPHPCPPIGCSARAAAARSVGDVPIRVFGAIGVLDARRPHARHSDGRRPRMPCIGGSGPKGVRDGSPPVAALVVAAALLLAATPYGGDPRPERGRTS